MDRYPEPEDRDIPFVAPEDSSQAETYTDAIDSQSITAPDDNRGPAVHEQEAWEVAPTYVPAALPPIRFRSLGDLQCAETSYVDGANRIIDASPDDAEVAAQGTRPLLEVNVDVEYARLPTEQIDFRESYGRYCERTYTPEYAAFVGAYAEDIIRDIERSGGMPDSFVAMPSRKETYTSRAVQTVFDGHQSQDLRPHIIVLHNDITRPEPATMADMAAIRTQDSATLLDLHCSPEQTIGEMRAVLADIVMEVCSRLGEVRSMILADADIRSIHGAKGYDALLEPLRQHPDLGAVVGNYFFDPHSVSSDETFALRMELQNEMVTVVNEYIPESQHPDRFITGACAAINTARLPMLGGIPRTNIGEDFVLGQKMRWFSPPGTPGFIIADVADVRVGIGAERLAYDFRHAQPLPGDTNGSRYTDWDRSANILRGSDTTHYPLDEAAIKEAARRMVSYYSQGNGAIELIDVAGMPGYKKCVAALRERLGTVLAVHGIV